MTPEDAAKELLRREAAAPGTFPPGKVESARQLMSGPKTLPEQEITPRDKFDPAYGQDRESGGVERAIGKGVGALFTAADSFTNSALLGIPHATGFTGPQTQDQKDLEAEHPYASAAGDIAGYASKANPANLVAGGLVGAARGAAPMLAETALGRIVGGAGQGMVAGGLGAGGRTAVEGGSPEDVGKAGLVGGAVGGALGGAGQAVVGEGSNLLRRAVRSVVPEIPEAEAGGATMHPIKGAQPGPELGKLQREAAAAQVPSGTDYQAGKLVEPLTRAGQAESEGVRDRIAQELQTYHASPAGQQRQPMTRLLDAFTREHEANVSGESGAPLAGADLGFFKQNINNLAEIKIEPPSHSGGMSEDGQLVLSMDEAARKGFDTRPAVAKFMKENPAFRGGFSEEEAQSILQNMDVVVTPRRYNSAETVQATRNLDAYMKAQRQRGGPVSPALDRAAHEQNDAFPGLSDLRAGHKALEGDLEGELQMAGVPTKGQYANANDEKALFNSVRGYGQEGRIPEADQALRSQAGKAGPETARQLELIKAIRALESLKGESVGLRLGATGHPYASLPKRAVGTRADALLELLGQAPVSSAASAGGQEEAQRRQQQLLQLLGL